MGFVALAKRVQVSVLSEEVDELLLAAEWVADRQRLDYEFLVRLEPVLTSQGRWRAAVQRCVRTERRDRAAHT